MRGEPESNTHLSVPVAISTAWMVPSRTPTNTTASGDARIPLQKTRVKDAARVRTPASFKLRSHAGLSPYSGYAAFVVCCGILKMLDMSFLNLQVL